MTNTNYFERITNHLGGENESTYRKRHRPKTRYFRTPSPGVKMDPMSKCVPDQSMSVNDILARTLPGHPIVGKYEPVYSGETYFPQKLDFGDKHQLKLELEAQNKADLEAFKANEATSAAAKQKQRESARKAQIAELAAEMQKIGEKQ
jgi:hypothetical protein